ncbi:hypothetical protein TWF481_009793 [Arthrobotrys musiformis]|uniref:Extracellular membrane protein CFEM domain-containing protein n=1 Tax=Arthrobotrys musiformis TaxID=47236 RepID=A0AAV9W4V2_9PEZI
MHIPTLLLLTADLALAKFNWGAPWKNSKLDGWPLYVEPTGKKSGWYQLDCHHARLMVDKEIGAGKGQYLGGPNNPDTDPFGVIEDCERSCRCNMFGEFLLSPLAGERCNSDVFLEKCIATENAGLGCTCKWIQQQPMSESHINTASWRPQPDDFPGSDPSAPQQHSTLPGQEKSEMPVGHHPNDLRRRLSRWADFILNLGRAPN